MCRHYSENRKSLHSLRGGFSPRHEKAPPSCERRGFFTAGLRGSNQWVAHVQDLHAVGAADGVVAVALGQDDPVALLDHTALEQLVHGSLADLLRRQRGRVERYGVDTTEHRRAGLGFTVRGKRVDRYRGTDPRHDQRRVAAFGQGNDPLDAREVVGGVHGRQRDALVAAFEDLADTVAGGLAGRVLFSADTDTRHGLHRFQRVGTGGTFGREHHGVGVVQHGVGYVGDFGAGRHRVEDHRLHHLGRNDHRLVVAACMQNDILLDAHQLGVADFHTEVTTGNHHRVAGHDQAVEGFVVGHGFGTFDLRHQPGSTAGLVAQFTGVFHVGGVAWEGHREVVHFHFGGELDVGLVFFGQGRGGQAATATVDTLVVRQWATDQHHAVQLGLGRGFNAHHHATVVEQQFVVDAAILDQIRVVDTDDLLVALGQRMAGGEGEVITDLEFDTFVGELGNTDLRALQVTQQRDETPVLGREVAHQLGTSLVLVGSTVGEVQTGNVQASEDQLFENFRRVAGRAQCGDDFSTTNGHAETPEFKRSERLLCSSAVVIVHLHYFSANDFFRIGCLANTLEIFAIGSIH